MDELVSLVADYRIAILEGNYRPTAEGLIADYARRRGLNGRELERRQLAPLREAIETEQYVRSRMLALGQLAYNGLAEGRLGPEVDEVLPHRGAAPAGEEGRREALWATVTRLNELVNRVVEGEAPSDELIRRVLVWVRPYLSDRLFDDVRRVVGTTGELVSRWYLYLNSGLPGFRRAAVAYPRGERLAFFLSFARCRASYAVMGGNAEALGAKTGPVSFGELREVPAPAAPRADLLEALGGLSREDREVLLLTLPVEAGGEELCEEQAAARLGCSPLAYRNRKRAARGRLKSVLGL